MRGGDERTDVSRPTSGTPGGDPAPSQDADPVSALLAELARSPERDPGAIGPPPWRRGDGPRAADERVERVDAPDGPARRA